jgi:hypothetical protein
VSLRIVNVLLACVIICTPMNAEDFAVFPDRKELRSPDGRYVIRSVEHTGQAQEITGVFRTLVLQEVSTGRSRGCSTTWARSEWPGRETTLLL